MQDAFVKVIKVRVFISPLKILLIFYKFYDIIFIENETKEGMNDMKYFTGQFFNDKANNSLYNKVYVFKTNREPISVGDILSDMVNSNYHYRNDFFIREVFDSYDDYFDHSSYSKERITDSVIAEIEVWSGCAMTNYTTASYVDKKKGNNFMSDMFNIDFGKVTSKDLVSSIYGVAIRGEDNRFRAYSTEKQKTVDVTGMTFGNNFLYKMPVSPKDLKVGDVIENAGQYQMVTKVISNKEISVIDLAHSEKRTVVPTENMFGFNFYTKIFSPLTEMITPTTDNPFGMNPMAMMFLSDSHPTNDNMMMAMMMSGGMENASMYLPMIMMKDGNSKNDLLSMFMMMQMMNNNNKTENTTVSKTPKEED